MSRIVIHPNRCKGCGLCTVACPYELVRISDRFSEKGYRPAVYVDPDAKCIGCANCATMCPEVAITVYRTRRDRSTIEPERATTQQRAAQPGRTP